MTVAVFHGSPRKGNTYKATRIFMDELETQGGVRFIEFFLPAAVPEFCTGCQQCLGGPYERCPHHGHVEPVVSAILEAGALIFAVPHYAACAMPGCMKNLLDHLDFFTLTVAPRRKIFEKKAFVLTTGSGSASAARPIARFLKNWGINRVYSLGLRMFTDKWEAMPERKGKKSEMTIRRAARCFYGVNKKRPYLSVIAFYYASAFIMKRFIGAGSYPYEYWREQGFLKKRPF